MWHPNSEIRHLPRIPRSPPAWKWPPRLWCRDCGRHSPGLGMARNPSEKLLIPRDEDIYMYVYIYHICNRTYTATIILMVGIVWVRLKMGNGNFWSEIMINHVIAFFKSGANPKIAWKSRSDHGLLPVWVYIVRVWLKIHIVHYIYIRCTRHIYIYISYIYICI